MRCRERGKTEVWYWKGEYPKEGEVLGEGAAGPIEARRAYFHKAGDPDGKMTPKDRIAILAVRDHAITHRYGEILIKNGRFIPTDDSSEETISFAKAHCEYAKHTTRTVRKDEQQGEQATAKLTLSLIADAIPFNCALVLCFRAEQFIVVDTDSVYFRHLKTPSWDIGISRLEPWSWSLEERTNKHEPLCCIVAYLERGCLEGYAYEDEIAAKGGIIYKTPKEAVDAYYKDYGKPPSDPSLRLIYDHLTDAFDKTFEEYAKVDSKMTSK